MQRQTFRQWGMSMVAASLGLVGAGVLVGALTNASQASAVRASWAVLAIAAAYVVCVRPCLVVEDAGVTIRNIVRDVQIPWSSVDGTHVRWELVVDTPSGSYSSWAISASPGPSRDPRPGRRGGPPGQAGSYPAPGSMATGVAASVGAESAALSSGVANDARATTIAAVVQHHLGRYLAEVDAGRAAEAPRPPRVVVVWWAVAVLAVPAAVAVVLTLTRGT